jgi:glyceraldehyde-3-phosphate dehydrogenase/erythrose-4-phosphate dehydrogenase
VEARTAATAKAARPEIVLHQADHDRPLAEASPPGTLHRHRHRPLDEGRVPHAAHLESTLTVDGREIRVFSESDPDDLPWGELEIDVVIESTGRFRDRDGAGKHLTADAQRVIVSSDIVGSPYSAIFDAGFTSVIDETFVKVLA